MCKWKGLSLVEIFVVSVVIMAFSAIYAGMLIKAVNIPQTKEGEGSEQKTAPSEKLSENVGDEEKETGNILFLVVLIVIFILAMGHAEKRADRTQEKHRW